MGRMNEMAGWEEFFEKKTLTKEERKLACNRHITTEFHMEQLILKYFSDEDFSKVWERKIDRKSVV